ncbi:hypothetical protein ACJ73_00947 [Blastomyces percursus]|uniref:Uncharacterized protein n=1 Tax=Blastomyces percursus TaxID=1658174 RepID=A0A1J9R5P3_9EURO|nr:hypothetical protein ACJ73_00947 [Blastomyces percursus]
MSTNLLQFYFNIGFVQSDYEVQRETRDPQSYWYPPTDPNAVSVVATTGWRKWDAGSITQALRNCKKSSVEKKIRTTDEAHGWRRLTFKHPEPIDSGDHLSVLAFDATFNIFTAPGSPRWMAELMPHTYDYNNLDIYVSGQTALAGNLALLIGLAAFSGPFPDRCLDVERSVNAIRAFRPPHWVAHGMKSRRPHGRGVIVSIRGIEGNETVPDKWARGDLGPLIRP